MQYCFINNKYDLKYVVGEKIFSWLLSWLVELVGGAVVDCGVVLIYFSF